MVQAVQCIDLCMLRVQAKLAHTHMQLPTSLSSTSQCTQAVLEQHTVLVGPGNGPAETHTSHSYGLYRDSRGLGTSAECLQMQ